MKAVIYTEYGNHENLQYTDAPKPAPKDDEVLIKVHAASVNSWDWDLLRGRPYIVRMGGWRKPKYKILGADVAGTVEATGKNITQFKPGDAVFADLSGYKWGGFAEYVCAPEKPLAHKPALMNFEQAAALPQAGVLALQGLHRYGNIQPGQQVLLNGAGGGVGTLALQMAKMQGATVTAVDRADKLDMLLQLGADDVMDYAKEDFTQSGRQYDLILDVITTKPVGAYKRVLKPGGAYVVVGGSMKRIFQVFVSGPFIRLFSGKKMGLLVHRPNRDDLNTLAGLFETGKLAPVIDRVYPLHETAEAVRRLGAGDVKGKGVVKM